MKKSVFLILLFYWNHACSQWSRCSTGIVITNQAISLPSSKHAGAEVFLLRQYQAASLTVCLEECCSGKYGVCSVAEYKNNSADSNCLYYSCQPIPKCKFMDSEGTDTFTFPTASRNLSSMYNVLNRDDEDYNKVNGKALTESARILQPLQRTFKDHPRAVSARKGVQPLTIASNEDSSVTSKAVSLAHLANGDSSEASDSFKDHPRTVAARKGVQPFTTASNEGSFVTWKEVSTMHLGNGDSLKSPTTYEDHARPVSARKGVEFSTSAANRGSSESMFLDHGDSSKSSDTVIVQDILSKSESSFKNDNTTIKPRKGVDSEIESVPVKIKARKGVEIANSSTSINAPKISKSKVKPRKGAVLLPLSVITMPVLNKTASVESVLKLSSGNTVPDMDTKHFAQTLPSDSAVSTDLISVLEQVFHDESVSAGASSEFRDRTPIGPSASNSFTISPTPTSSTKYSEYITLPSNSAMTDRSSAPVFTESSSMPLHSVLPSKTSGHHEKVAESTPPLIAVTEHVKFSSESSPHVSGHVSNPSHAPVLQTSMNAENSVSSDQSILHHDPTVLLFTVSSPNKTKMSILSSMGDLESERKYKSSMHLVLSLIFGLLVLFLVLGVVAKRVYDVWMRRHYHRMDFLIDGMYDGFS